MPRPRVTIARAKDNIVEFLADAAELAVLIGCISFGGWLLDETIIDPLLHVAFKAFHESASLMYFVIFLVDQLTEYSNKRATRRTRHHVFVVA